MEYTFWRKPEIDQSDLPFVTELLRCFDRVEFNNDAELLGISTLSVPVIGSVIVSYYVNGSHMQVRRMADDAVIGAYEIVELNDDHFLDPALRDESGNRIWEKQFTGPEQVKQYALVIIKRAMEGIFA